MKRRIIFALLMSVLVMLGLPMLVKEFANADAGMGLCFILFFAVNPVLSALIGVSAGKNSRRLCWLPLVPAVLFQISAWIFFETGELVIFTTFYLVLAYLAMVISSFVYNVIDGKR